MWEEIGHLLTYDPLPWLMAQDGLPALRARRLLGLRREGDAQAVCVLERELARDWLVDGSSGASTMGAAGVLNLLDDLRVTGSAELIAASASYLLSILQSQPGYEAARDVTPGGLRTPCDLCGFFGPYEDRSRPEVMAQGAREMNCYRQSEPLLGPKSPVRGVRRSSLDRAGPSSCYAWGLIPLAYVVESLCRAGYAHDERLQPAANALLGAQRESGGWCRNLAGSPECTIHAIRALGSHPDLRHSEGTERALMFMRAAQRGALDGKAVRWWRGSNLFAAIQAIAAFDSPVAREIIRDALEVLAERQRKNGTFGGPCRVERVTAVLVAAKSVSTAYRPGTSKPASRPTIG
jgi:hypothetical protein